MNKKHRCRPTHRLLPLRSVQRRGLRRRPVRLCAEHLEARIVLASDVLISEIQASNNTTIADQDGDYSDWIEIHNAGRDTIDLGGWYLTDDSDDLTKWQFPGVTLDPDEYLLVFVSGKNRVAANSELHANFQLSADGEYLGLVEPDGLTVVSEFSPDFPAQFSDLSYGVAIERDVASLLESAAPTTALVPTDDSLALNWIETTFDDNHWISGSTAIGYERLAEGFTVRDDFDAPLGAEWSIDIPPTGTSDVSVSDGKLLMDVPSGQDSVGDRGLAPLVLRDAPTQNSEYEVVTRINLAEGLGGGGLVVTDGVSGEPVISVQLVKRSNFLGAIDTISGGTTIHTQLLFNSRNAFLRIARDPFADTWTTFFKTDTADNWTELVTVTEGAGDVPQISSPQLGLLGRTNTSSAMFEFESFDLIVADEQPVYAPLTGLDVEAAMFETNASIYARVPFHVVGDPSRFDELDLSIEYDDGFVAYLNGVEIASRNVNDNTSWNSTATASFGAVDGQIPVERIDLDLRVGLLQEGNNVLAIHGANVAADDGDFFLRPAVTAAEILSITPRFFTTPTPGAANDFDSSFLSITTEPEFSVESGFYDNDFELELTTTDPDAIIRYTLDSSEPTEQSSPFTDPIMIDSTTVVRAATFRAGHLTLGDAARSYLFLDDVLQQDGTGLPETWGTFVENSPLGVYRAGDPVPANYEVDPEVVNDPRYSDTIRDDLRAIPSLSLVFSPEDIWSEETGLYSNTTETGIEWERPVAAELIDTDGSIEFRVNAGARIHGGFSRRPNASAKHSIRLLFKGEYGPNQLRYPWFGEDAVDEFETIVLRASYNFSWARGERNNTQHSADGTFVADRWASVLQDEMGGLAPDGTWVHLYINGLYWGLYNPNERPSAPFQASYQGGSREDYDVLKIGEVIDGDGAAWNELMTAVRQNPIDYDAVKQMLDVPGFIDYMMINQFGGNEDWPHNNWYASRRRQAGAQWKFHSWDAEFLFRDVNTNRVTAGGNNGPGEIYNHLRTIEEFRVEFGDRVHRHFFNEGKLTPNANIERLDRVTAPIDRAIVGESARWGDALFDNIEPARTRDDHWIPRLEELKTSYFPARTEIVLGQYRGIGLYPAVEAPAFNQHGGSIDPGFALSMSSADGTIYYTTDGSDPRQLGGGLNPAAIAYNEPIELLDSELVMARTLDSNDLWSALNEATFVIDRALPLRITEIMYHPADPDPGSTHDADDFEFVELTNIGEQPLNPVGTSFFDGIEFTFPSMQIAPGERVVVVRNIEAFQSRYGDETTIAGEFANGQLSNNGERIGLQDGRGMTVLDFSYDDNEPWPERADGIGGSIEITDLETATTEYGAPDRWRGSTEFHGSPGSAGAGPIGVVVNEVLARSTPPMTPADSIELVNVTTKEINIGGWYLSDAAGELLKYAIPAGTTLGPGEYVVIDESEFNPRPADPRLGDFALSGVNGDDVWVVIPDGEGGIVSFVDEVHFGAAVVGETWGRFPNGRGPLTPLNRNTLGCANSHPRVGPVVVTEINYHPESPSATALAVEPSLGVEDLEFIEVFNPTVDAVDLTQWRLRGSVDYDFAEGQLLPPGSAIVIVSFDPTVDENVSRKEAFLAHYQTDESFLLVGGWDGQLRDRGERIELQRPGAPLVDDLLTRPRLSEDLFDYDEVPPWPSSSGGTGNSLHRVTPVAFGMEGGHWSSQPATPGSIGFSLAEQGDLTGDGIVDANDIDVLFNAVQTNSGVSYYDLDGNGTLNEEDVDFLVRQVLAALPGDANLDGAVDAIDLDIWNAHRWTGCSGWGRSDFNGDGVTDGSDFNIWNDHRFMPAAQAAVDFVSRIPRGALPVKRVELSPLAAIAIPQTWQVDNNNAELPSNVTQLANDLSLSARNHHEVKLSSPPRKVGQSSSSRRQLHETHAPNSEQQQPWSELHDKLFAGWH